MSQRRHRASWLALSIVLAAKALLVLINFRFIYGEWWPSNLVPFTFALFLYGEVVSFAFACLGICLLSRARSGGGRWAWRWWLGGLLTISWVWDVAYYVVQLLGPVKVFYIAAEYWWLSDVLLVLAIPPLWVLAGQRKRA